jgi:hypothetical protein
MLRLGLPRLRAGLFGLALVASGCGGGEAAESEVAFSTIARSSNSGVATPTFAVVSDAGAWGELWRRHTAAVVPPPVPPAVDFARHQVVGVFLGARPSGCHAVQVRKVLQSAVARIVVYHEDVPGPTALCTAQVVTPAHLVQLPASPLPVEFRAE